MFSIGVNVFVVRDKKLLLGLRKNCYRAGEWGLPGGHLKEGEGMIAAGARELLEETGLILRNPKFENMVNTPGEEKHYVQVAFSGEAHGEPVNKEPEFCEEWRWFSLDALPQNIFLPHQKSVEAFLSGRAAFVDSIPY